MEQKNTAREAQTQTQVIKVEEGQKFFIGVGDTSGMTDAGEAIIVIIKL